MLKNEIITKQQYDISCGCLHNNTLLPPLPKYNNVLLPGVVLFLPRLPRVWCVAAQWCMRRVGAIHHLNQAETTAKATFDVAKKSKNWRIWRDWRRSAGFYRVTPTCTKHNFHPYEWSRSSRDKVSPSGVGREWWPIGRKLRCRSEAAEGGGDGWSALQPAERLNDERVCETAVCFYLFLLGVLFLNDIFLSFRHSRHGFIGKQDGASGHIVHLPLYMVGEWISMLINSQLTSLLHWQLRRMPKR